MNRPVRLRLDRRVDFAITGHRHPFKVNYRVGFNHEGRLSGLDIRTWSNGGWSIDASIAVMQLSMLHMGNTHRFQHRSVTATMSSNHARWSF